MSNVYSRRNNIISSLTFTCIRRLSFSFCFCLFALLKLFIVADARTFLVPRSQLLFLPPFCSSTDSVLQQESRWDLVGSLLLCTLAKHMQTERIRCPSKRNSLQLCFHVVCLHCQKSAVANFSEVFSLESALLTWALVFFPLFFSPNTSSCHFLL